MTAKVRWVITSFEMHWSPRLHCAAEPKIAQLMTYDVVSSVSYSVVEGGFGRRPDFS